ncbi:hypothetical protein CEB3_c27070 [Peptococcaceae bacterium CEB3]|nr:hypothetical protein CEB3_c27070 [Peptococcaceae bacterium CEB3]
MTSQRVRAEFKRMCFSLEEPVVYRNLTGDPLIEAFGQLFRASASEKSDFDLIHRWYYHICGLALELGWPEHLANLIMEDENLFSKAAAAAGDFGLNPALRASAMRDLEMCRALVAFSARRVKEGIAELWNEQASGEYALCDPPMLWPEWGDGPSLRSVGDLLRKKEEPKMPEDEECGGGLTRTWKADGRGAAYGRRDVNARGDAYGWWDERRLEIEAYLMGSGSVEEMVDFLARCHFENGYGLLSRYLAFRWEGHCLKGIVNPDCVQRTQLFGLERELSILAENTEHFLAGFRANNVLLYGNRGTGKSSAVKALLDTYWAEGLRLVELSKSALADLPEVVRSLGGSQQKFILFVDDLSFDDTELGYKSLKTVLEGGLAAEPGNVLIYATSNRRHLVKENFADRRGDEVHAGDSVDEKLSLADRFGLTITFSAPDQKGYLGIVRGLARRRGLSIEDSELERMALRWEMTHNGRSGRTARQFVDYLEGYIALAAADPDEF